MVFLLRFSIILVGYQLTDSDNPKGGDHGVYYTTAGNLALNGEAWFQAGSEFGYRAPLYFVFLAAIYAVVSAPPYLVAQIASAMLGALNCLLLYFLVRNVLDERSARLAFWIRGVVPSFVIADTFALSEPLFGTFLLSAMVILFRRSDDFQSIRPIFLGIFIGACMLTREVAIVYPIIVAGLFLLMPGSGKQKTKHIIVFTVALILVLSPWMWRNITVWGKPLPLSYTSGVNLHIGNNPQATGKWVNPPETGMPSDVKWGTPEYESWHRQQAIAFIIENPAQFFVLGIKRIAWFLWPRFLREDIDTVYGVRTRLSLAVSLLCGMTTACIFLLGLLGFVTSKRDWFWWICMLLLTYSTIVTFVVAGAPRYRDSIDYLLLPYTAYVIIHWRELRMSVSFEEQRVRIVLALYACVFASWCWVAIQLGWS